MAIEFQIGGLTRRAALWLPEGVAKGGIRDLSLVVFLHAYEERGDDSEHLGVGIGPALDARPDLWARTAVLLPQCPAGHVWSQVDRAWAAGCDAAEEHIDAAIAAACSRHAFGEGRITLTGASMGGFGTFVYGARRAKRFAAFGPVCGGGIEDEVVSLANRPVWAWHAQDDDVVMVAETEAMLRAIRDAGGSPRSSLPAEGGHAVWDRAYLDPNFAAFLTGDSPNRT